MDFTAELARSNLDPALADWLSATLAQAQKDAQSVAQKTVELKAADIQIKAADIKLKAADLKINALIFELAHYKRIRFANKSEAFSAEQRELFEESWNTDTSVITAEVEQLASLPKQRSRAGRQPLPEHLPRIEYRHEPATCTCGQCGKDLVKIGEDVSEQLDVEPARFFVNRPVAL